MYQVNNIPDILLAALHPFWLKQNRSNCRPCKQAPGRACLRPKGLQARDTDGVHPVTGTGGLTRPLNPGRLHKLMSEITARLITKRKPPVSAVTALCSVPEWKPSQGPLMQISKSREPEGMHESSCVVVGGGVAVHFPAL